MIGGVSPARAGLRSGRFDEESHDGWIREGSFVTMQIRSPIVLLGAPRSGTSMLFNALSAHPDLWSLYRESGALIERYFPVTMEPGSSDVVESEDLNDETIRSLRQLFVDSVGNMGSRHLALSSRSSAFLRTFAGRRMMQLPGISKFRLGAIYSRAGRQRKPPVVRIVEKTPENCFRVQLLDRLFPDALFVYITRDPRQSIASIYTGWTKSTEFRRFPFPTWFRLSDYRPRWWSFGLVPDWEKLNGSTLIEVCATQWLLYNQRCRMNLPAERSRVLRLPYEETVRRPAETMQRLAEWAELDPAPFKRFEQSLPVVNTFTDPRDEKWRRLQREIGSVEPLIRGEARALGYDI